MLTQKTLTSKSTPFPSARIPRRLRRYLTFMAPLNGNTTAFGRGASVAATLTRATIATYIHPVTGLVTEVASGVPRFEANGYLSEGARTNICLYSNDFTNAAWVAVNMTAAATSTGPDGVASSASRLTATAADATIKQSITSGSAARVTSCWVKRITGTGAVSMTQDDGATWAAVTLTTAWTRASIASATLANPIVGFKIATDTDAIDVSFFQHEVGAFISSAIPTTSAAVVRNGDSNTYVASGNISNPGTVFVVADFTVNSNQVLAFDTRNTSNVTGVAILQDSNAKPRSLVSNTTTQADMSISTDNFAAGVPKSLALAWDSSDFQFISSGGLGNGTDTSGTVPATHTRIGVGISGANAAQSFGHVRSVAILASRLSAFDMARLR